MKSLTIHDLDPVLDKKIRSRSRDLGLSLNKTIKKLLEESVGIRPKDETRYRGHFEQFCGSWTRAEGEAFENAVAESRKIDEELWK